MHGEGEGDEDVLHTRARGIGVHVAEPAAVGLSGL